MYWYRSKPLLIAALGYSMLFISSLQSCKPDIKETGAKLKYFDLKGYFEHDSARLTRLNKPVLKSAMHNDVTETKKVYINDWGTELSLFKASDINRPAWNNSYTTTADSNILIYKAKYPELKTREIMIKLSAGKVKWILIYNSSKNILYSNIEKLSYFPDSLYWIEKKQTVKLLGTNKYQVKGFFNQ